LNKIDEKEILIAYINYLYPRDTAKACWKNYHQFIYNIMFFENYTRWYWSII